ncbi:MAG: hypothetical protein JWM74_1827, partial [Myxococcaceae bacterium]|nr:hypothetical protein [Myxococcaceae bacterium]
MRHPFLVVSGFAAASVLALTFG